MRPPYAAPSRPGKGSGDIGAPIRYFCDRVAVMHRGRVVETGSAEQICGAPREPYTQSLISAVPSPDPRRKRMMNRTRFVA